MVSRVVSHNGDAPPPHHGSIANEQTPLLDSDPESTVQQHGSLTSLITRKSSQVIDEEAAEVNSQDEETTSKPNTGILAIISVLLLVMA
ncbi:MAG: hypothetical protein L6R41_002847 [Letrouitia leprolyta]|nr:MAG: hypothetical protein L6R41_002847 [Letrouitia leprolyta]